METNDHSVRDEVIRENLLINERIKEIRELNNQENELINNRFTWLGVIEGLIITAYVTVLDKFIETKGQYVFYLYILAMLSFLGIIISYSFNHTLTLARISLKRLRDRYVELIEKLNTNDYIEWPIAIGLLCDCKDTGSINSINYSKNEWLDPWAILPKVFIAIWIILLGLVFWIA